MEWKLISTHTTDTATFRTYKVSNYNIKVVSVASKIAEVRVCADPAVEFVPEVNVEFDNTSAAIKNVTINTYTFGELSIEEMQEAVQRMQEAIEFANTLKSTNFNNFAN